ncbi:AAA family ATPase [Salinarimonas sp. NSM]|uniref:AAA family ATPase n=1 Tax=Salinarimonas sp. NSM TaxID=3458003 RepID=UPI0040359813
MRAFGIAMIGPDNAIGLNQVWREWQRQNAPPAVISATVVADREDVFVGRGRTASRFGVELGLSPREGSSEQLDLMARKGTVVAGRSIWARAENRGWFAASFGPYRRFTGGDLSYEKLFYSSPRLAGHLSAFNEAVALTEGLRWLSSLRVSGMETGSGRNDLLDAILSFINETELLPQRARIEEVRSDRVLVRDANGALVATDLLSDGYRSIFSMIFELIRQLDVAFERDTLVEALREGKGTVALPGVVAIDEVDAHLHPDWQAQIGRWFTRVFPRMQFLVTTHSPIVCRSARSVWWLPRPGSSEGDAVRVTGADFDRLTKGSILDAYGTELFGRGVSRSRDSGEMLAQLADLNRKALHGTLSKSEERHLLELRAALPSMSAALEA